MIEQLTDEQPIDNRPQHILDAWQQTYTGKAIHALDPRPEEICIEDIAHALALQCRFGGHCRAHYSVAEHSVRASLIAEELLNTVAVVTMPGFDDIGKVTSRIWCLVVLLHDAAETYCVDVPRPIKGHLIGYKEIEEKVHRAISVRFSIDPALAHHDFVKLIDNIMLATEKRDLMSAPPKPWAPLPPPHPAVIVPWSAQVAEKRFLERFEELGGKR